MCVTCKIPLNVAESPQADRERAFIQRLIDAGQDEAQIKRALVGQYGAAVLGLPERRTASTSPPTSCRSPPCSRCWRVLALLLPRWRRRARAQAPASAPQPPLAPADAARLEADLARFD